jgi:hypothetical protein
MPQITARLSPIIRYRFGRYATELGLDASELARLLITREMRVGRVLRRGNRHSARHGVSSAKLDGSKLTAHFHRTEKVAAFDRYARAQGFGRAAAVRVIVERELHEKWLAKALAWTPRKAPSKPS